MLGWPKISKLVHVFLWEHSYKRLKLAQLLGQLSIFLTFAWSRARRLSARLPGPFVPPPRLVASARIALNRRAGSASSSEEDPEDEEAYGRKTRPSEPAAAAESRLPCAGMLCPRFCAVGGAARRPRSAPAERPCPAWPAATTPAAAGRPHPLDLFRRDVPFPRREVPRVS